MQGPTPFVREVGTGPTVVCLHANASSSSQWRPLMELLAPQFHVFAIDSYGSGKSPAWPAGEPLRLRDEARLLEPILARAAEPFTLVGHSYGAAIALVTALAAPQRVRALALYEPTLFSLLNAEAPPPNEADGIRDAVGRAIAELDAGNPDGAAERFIDFWMGKNVWAHMPEPRKAPILASIVNLRAWSSALFGEPTPLKTFESLDIPVLYMLGKDSPASSLGVGRLLTQTLPRVQVARFDGLGHMGPVTHPDVVNTAIFDFLKQELHGK